MVVLDVFVGLARVRMIMKKPVTHRIPVTIVGLALTLAFDPRRRTHTATRWAVRSWLRHGAPWNRATSRRC